MAIGRISGPMLFSNLERQGIDLSVETDLLYIDVTNDRIGIKTATPGSELSVNGNISSNNVVASGTLVSTGVFPSAHNTGVVGNASVAWSSGTFTNLTVSNTLTVSGNIKLNDSDKLVFGDGSDMTIYHTPDTNIIDLANGNLQIRNASDGAGVYKIQVDRTSGNITVMGNVITSGGIYSTTGNLVLNGNVSVPGGVLTLNTVFANVSNIGNLSLSNNTLSSINANGNILLDPNGSGYVSAIGTNGMVLPVGTTAQRPVSPPEGVIRYNTSINYIEFFNGTEWLNVGPELTQIEMQTLVGDGSTSEFTLLKEASAAGLLVSINGTVQKPDSAYTVLGSTISFAEAPLLGDTIDVRYISISYDFSSPTLDSYTRAEVLALTTMSVGDIVYVEDGIAGNPAIAFYTGSGWEFVADNEFAVVYPAAGIPVSTGSAWTTSKTAPSGNLVGTTDTQELTNKTLNGSTLSGAVDVTGRVKNSVVAIPATNIDCSLGNYFTKTVAGDTTFTFSNIPATGAYEITVEITHTSGVISWPSSVRWPDATTPILSTGKVHVFRFLTVNGGTKWRASADINYSD